VSAKPITEETKAALRTLQVRSALLRLAIAHPEKLDDEKAVSTVSQLALKVAEARITLKEANRAGTTTNQA
jgi:hypothetical protein